MSNFYSDQSAEAAAKIKAGFCALGECFASGMINIHLIIHAHHGKSETDPPVSTGNVTDLKNELGLYTEPTANSTDLGLLSSFLQQTFSFATELNYSVAQPGRTPIGHPL